MQEIQRISKSPLLTIPSNVDLIPIIDINGGYGGKPKLKNITVSNLFAEVNNEFNDVYTQINGVYQYINNRAISSKTLSVTGNINPNTYLKQNISLGNAYLLTKLTASISDLRIRLYLSDAFASTDIPRAIGGTLPTSHGLIYEAVLKNGTVLLDVLPTAIGMPNNDTVMVINNLSTSVVLPLITFAYIPLF